MRTGPATPLGLDPGPCPERRGVSREAAAAGSGMRFSLATPLSPPPGSVSGGRCGWEGGGGGMCERERAGAKEVRSFWKEGV